MRQNWLASFLLLAVAAPSWGVARPVQTEFTPVTYKCERDVELPVIYVSDVQGRSNLIMVIDDKLLILPQVVSASGARYRDADKAAISYELWNKGDKATILYGSTEDAKTLYEDCTEITKDEDPQ